MAHTINYSRFTTVTSAESADSGNWIDIVGGQGSTQTTAVFIQGSEARSRNVSNSQRGMWYNYGSGIDCTDKHVYIWINILSTIDTAQNAGLVVRLGTSTTNYAEYYVAGSDTKIDYGGGWRCFVIDPSSTPSATGGSGLTVSSIQYFGAYVTTVVTSAFANFYIDQIVVGDYITVTGSPTTSGDSFAEIISSEATDLRGIIEIKDGITYVRTGIRIGSPGGNTLWEQEGGIFVFPRYEHYGTAGSPLISINHDLWYIEAETGSPSTTDIRFGRKIGSPVDDAIGADGVIILAEGDRTWKLKMGDTLVDSVGWYGSILEKVGSPVLGDDQYAYISTTFNNCEEIEPSNAVIRKCTIANATGNGFLWGSPIDIADTTFNNNAYSIHHDTGGTFSYDGLIFNGAGSPDTYDILNDSGSPVTINAINNSNPSLVSNTGGSTTTINNAKTLTLTGLIANTEVRVLETGTQTEIDGVENSGTSFVHTYNYTAGIAAVDIVIHHLDYEYIFLENVARTSTGTSIPIQQRSDRYYSNP